MTRSFAGFWVRVLAFAFDYIAIALYLVLITIVSLTVNFAFPNLPQALFGNPVSGAGLTQEEVAQKLRTKKSAISRIENHADDVRLSTLYRYAQAVGANLHIRLAPV